MRLIPTTLTLLSYYRSAAYSFQIIRSNYRQFGNTIMSSKENLKPLQIGLTGSIGMGKSTVTNQFRFLGFEVFDADQAVHQLYGQGGAAVEPIKQLFPNAIADEAVDRKKLGAYVLNNEILLQQLEGIVHPLVANERKKFLMEAWQRGAFFVVYDIPLLLENRKQHEVDYIIVVTADRNVQEKRVLERPGMTKEKFESILRKQMPDEEKRKLADFIVHTDIGVGYSAARAQLANIIEKIVEAQPTRFAEWVNRRPLKDIHPEYPFDLVAFDLDDTLVPTMPPVIAAYEEKYAYMAVHMPRSLPQVKLHMRTMMQSLVQELPHISHDFAAVRRYALTSIAEQHDEQHHVDEAVRVFEDKRSEVEVHLYEDTYPCLEHLVSKGIKCCVMTNGSADLNRCTQLIQLLEFSLNAREIGAMKPSVVPFMSISLKSGIPPRRILYVGDSYENDVVGANKAGMQSALLCRDAREGTVYQSVVPDIELVSLHPSEIEAKVTASKRTKSS